MSLRRSLQTPEQHAMFELGVEAGQAAPQLFWCFAVGFFSSERESFLFFSRSTRSKERKNFTSRSF